MKCALLAMDTDGSEESASVSVEPSFTPAPKGCAQAAEERNKTGQRSLFMYRSYSGASRGLLARGARGQFVASVIVVVIGVSLGPAPLNRVPAHQSVQLLPEVPVHNRLFFARPPAVAFPILDPGRDAAFEILRIGHNLHLARLAQPPQALNGRFKLHSVVGGGRFSAPQLLFVAAIA